MSVRQWVLSDMHAASQRQSCEFSMQGEQFDITPGLAAVVAHQGKSESYVCILDKD